MQYELPIIIYASVPKPVYEDYGASRRFITTACAEEIYVIADFQVEITRSRGCALRRVCYVFVPMLIAEEFLKEHGQLAVKIIITRRIHWLKCRVEKHTAIAIIVDCEIPME